MRPHPRLSRLPDRRGWKTPDGGLANSSHGTRNRSALRTYDLAEVDRPGRGDAPDAAGIGNSFDGTVVGAVRAASFLEEVCSKNVPLDEWEINVAVCKLAAQYLFERGYSVDILDATVPEPAEATGD